MPLRPRLRLPSAVVGLTAAALLAAGPGEAQRAGIPIRIVERDFSIKAAREVGAGDVMFSVRNAGPEDHELIVVRLQGRLPFRRDGLTLDEDALEPRTVGSLEPGLPGSTRTLRVHLAPGRYLLFCNMTGHYLGGMHVVLTVR
jgi:uncharacterized cupredoxin-like copper-binding protein